MRLSEEQIKQGLPQALSGRIEGLGDLLALLKYVTEGRDVTFVYAAGDEERNSAVALKQFLERGQK